MACAASLKIASQIGILLLALLGLNQEGAARILHHFVCAAILDLERLNGEHKQSIIQIPGIRDKSSRIPHRYLLEFRKVSKFPVLAILGNQTLPEVFPLRVQNLVIKGELPALLSFYQAKFEFVVYHLAGQFIAKTVPTNGTFYQTTVSFLIYLDETALSQLIQNDFPGVSLFQVRVDESGSQIRHSG